MVNLRAFFPCFCLTVAGFFLNPGAQAADKTTSRCEQSFGKQPVATTVETCRSELIDTTNTEKRIAILETLGQAYLTQQEPEQAISAWNEASQYNTPSREKPKGAETWTRLQILIGQTHMQMNEMQKAENQLVKTLATAERAFGRHSLPAAMAQDALGAFHAVQNNAEKAEEAFKRARIIHEVRLGKNHIRTLETRMSHAIGLLDLKKEKEAQETFQILADIINSLPEYQGEPIRAEILTFLGTLQMRHDQTLNAIVSYQTALEVRQNAFGPNDIRTSQSLNNLGVVLYRAGELKQAEAVLSKAYVIRTDLLGSEDPLTQSTQKNLQAVIAAQAAKTN